MVYRRIQYRNLQTISTSYSPSTSSGGDRKCLTNILNRLIARVNLITNLKHFTDLFLVITRRLNILCQLFGTLCLFHLHRQVGVKMEQTVFQNFGVQNSDAEELPTRKHTIFGTRRKFEIKNFTGRLCYRAPSLKMCLLLLAESPKHVKVNWLRMLNWPCIQTLLCK